MKPILVVFALFSAVSASAVESYDSVSLEKAEALFAQSNRRFENGTIQKADLSKALKFLLDNQVHLQKISKEEYCRQSAPAQEAIESSVQSRYEAGKATLNELITEIRASAEVRLFCK